MKKQRTNAAANADRPPPPPAPPKEDQDPGPSPELLKVMELAAAKSPAELKKWVENLDYQNLPIQKDPKLEDLQSQVDQPITIRFAWQGKMWEVPARRLRPDEDAKLEEILLPVLPPVVRGKNIDEDRPDYSNPEYVGRKIKAEIKARSLALYWAVPMFSKGKPVVEEKEVTAFMQKQLNADILNLMYEAVRSGGVKFAEVVNFT